MILSDQEIKRYNRHIILSEIGLEGQQKLKQSKVLVIGAGGLGCPVLQYLTAAGIGTIGICDFDFVDESNLQRQILFGTSDIGKPKAIIAAQKLSNLNPFVKFNVYNQMLTKEIALELFQNYDIVVDGSDNFPTRFLINDACVILNKPYVFGAIYKFEGQITVFNYQNGPTYRCLVPEEPDSSESLSCSSVGVIGVLPGIIGAYQANEVIKMVTGVGEVLSGQLLLIDAAKMDHNILTIKRSENFANISELGQYGDFCHQGNTENKQISPQELYQKLENEDILVIDIREKQIFDLYHIKSKQLSIQSLLENPDLIPDNQQVVIVCEKGISSNALINELKKSGKRRNLINLEGGMQAWMRNNLPIISNKS